MFKTFEAGRTLLEIENIERKKSVKMFNIHVHMVDVKI